MLGLWGECGEVYVVRICNGVCVVWRLVVTGADLGDECGGGLYGECERVCGCVVRW